MAGLLSGSDVYGGSAGELNREVALLVNGSHGSMRHEAHDAIANMLSYVVSKTADAQEFFVLDLEGNILVSTTPRHDGMSQADEPYFVRGSSNTYAQPVSKSDLADTSVITIATPLFNRGGIRVAVVAAVLNLERLDRIVLQQTGLGESGETYLVGTDGRFVHARLVNEYPDPISSPGIDAALRQQDGRGLYENYAGATVIGVYRWLPRVGGALLAEMSQDEAFAPARRLALSISLIGLAVAALLGVGIYGVSRRIARPILAITDTAAAVKAGDLTREAPVTTNDEVGTLARTFNDMTTQFRGTLEELQASQRRLVAAQDEERRKLERNIHDAAGRPCREVASCAGARDEGRREDCGAPRPASGRRAVCARGSSRPRPRDLPTAAGRPGLAGGARGASPKVAPTGRGRIRRRFPVRARGRGGDLLLGARGAPECGEVRGSIARHGAPRSRRRVRDLQGRGRRTGVRPRRNGPWEWTPGHGGSALGARRRDRDQLEAGRRNCRHRTDTSGIGAGRLSRWPRPARPGARPSDRFMSGALAGVSRWWPDRC